MYGFYKQPPKTSVQKRSRKDLKILYESIPETEGCMVNINKAGGCGAVCCERQSPQVMFCEFLNTWNTVKHNWSNSALQDLLIHCVEKALDTRYDKGCVFWNSTSKLCKIHQVRPYNCRTYSQIPDDEWKPRYEKLKVLYPNAVMDQCGLTKTIGNRPTTQDMDKWFSELKVLEQDIGVDPSVIHGEDGGTYRCYHDHVLLMLATKEMLENIAALQRSSVSIKQKYVDYLKKSLYETKKIPV